MQFTEDYHKDVARKCGFRPFKELGSSEQLSIVDYCQKYYQGSNKWICDHYWKESTVGDGNWISYDVVPHDRIAAPHLKT